MAVKNYCVDTNVLLDDEGAIEILINGKNGGDQNNLYVPWTVLCELDGLKKDIRVTHRVARAVTKLDEFKSHIKVLSKLSESSSKKANDDKILEEIKLSNVDGLILVTNDRLLRFKAEKFGIVAEAFNHSNPFMAESQKYTGFVDAASGEELVGNCFYWKDGKLAYNRQGKEKIVDYDNSLWGLTPRTAYQNAFMELALDKNIDLITLQSEAGFGKTQLALAAALQLLAEKDEESGSKKYKKIFIFKPNWEIGNGLGFLPGNVDEKMEPYFRAIRDLVLKLHEKRPCNKIFEKEKDSKGNNKVSKNLEFDTKKFELLPINYIRGMTLENCIVIADEIQNLSRIETRSLLSRCGENVKFIITGDVNQIDNPYLNQENNGLNWVVSKMKGCSNYGHIVFSGKKSRGPIADMVRIRGL